MASFNSNQIMISYEERGSGSPILLIHGFASNAAINWLDTGWSKLLETNGYRVISFDNRGHGKSQKLYEPEFYSRQSMAEDAVNLLKHLNIAKAHILGYSMGARIALHLASSYHELVDRLIIGGAAANLLDERLDVEEIAEGLLAPSVPSVEKPVARMFRLFAERSGNDLRALAACIRGAGQKFSPAILAKITAPCLIVNGDQDDMAGPSQPLKRLIHGAQSVVLKGRNHMSSVGDQGFKDAVLSFLERDLKSV